MTDFRAVVRRAFELAGRGTLLSVEILGGKVAVGDWLVVLMSDGHSRTVEVRAVDYVDYDIGRPTFRAELGLTVGEIRPDEVAVGQTIYSATA